VGQKDALSYDNCFSFNHFLSVSKRPLLMATLSFLSPERSEGSAVSLHRQLTPW
jgi:hypothetical protein